MPKAISVLKTAAVYTAIFICRSGNLPILIMKTAAVYIATLIYRPGGRVYSHFCNEYGCRVYSHFNI